MTRGARPAAARRLATAALTAVALASCAGPVVEDRVHEIEPRALERIAVAPFVPSPNFRGDAAPGTPTGGDAAEAAALVTRFATEAFAAAGFEVIPASDVANLFTARGQVVPHGDAGAITDAAGREFGATAVLFGSVYRYRERQGGELGATRPASVGFELALHAAPSARVLWTARFDHAQRAVSEDVFGAPKYPGRGSRWLSAAELARWGADQAARKLDEYR